jgi:hypothetical protein
MFNCNVIHLSLIHKRIADDDDCDEILNEKKDKIPATEELKSVQPKREDEMIITHSGLKKVEVD